MLYTCVPLLHFDLMTTMIWPHPHILHRTFIYGDRIEQLRVHITVMVKILPLMNAMARMTFSPMRRQFVDLVHTHRGPPRFAGFRLPTCQAFTFSGASNVSNGQTKTQICLEPHPGGVGDISARLMIVSVKIP